MGTINLLVFPIDIDAARPFIKNALALGATVIGASSERYPPKVDGVSSVEQLPYITADNFAAELVNILKKHRISHAYTPHDGVWETFNDLHTANPELYNFKLCGLHPYTAQWLEFQPSYEWAQSFIANDIAPYITECSQASSLSQAQYAGLHYHFSKTPGQTGEDKLSALTSIFKHVLPGDIVEIGSLYGKSAFALGWLALKHQIGNVICVDPWNMSLVDDQGIEAVILNKQSHQINLEQVFKGFLVNTSPLNNIAYIKNTSKNAVKTYLQAAKANKLINNEGESVTVTGEISLLHIDGNHRYDHVRQDITCWEPLVKNGGWILVDDYLWAFGDGPQRAGDELLRQNRFDIAFCYSDTLFLRKCSSTSL